MLFELEATLNRMSQKGWHIILYPTKLPLFSNSFLMVARHPDFESLEVDLTVAEAEKRAILVALALTNNSVKETTKRLGISKAAFYRKVIEYDIDYKKRKYTGDVLPAIVA